jgi:2-keto-3-deoxy-6-phosphogluconate aldolase
MSAIDAIRSERIVAVLPRVPDVDAAIARMREAGIAVVEVTLDAPGALDPIGRHPGEARRLVAAVRG